MYNKYDIAVAAAVAVVVVVLIILLWAWDTGRLGRFSRGAGSSQDPDPAPTRVNVKTDAQQFADAETDAQTVLGGGNAPDVSSACGGLSPETCGELDEFAVQAIRRNVRNRASGGLAARLDPTSAAARQMRLDSMRGFNDTFGGSASIL